MEETILEMRGITKRFPGVLALDKVSLDLRKGEVLALVGENGAGKSTLMKILSGAYETDSGEIYIDGAKTEFNTPRQAIEFGISIMHQELNYLDELSIAENIFMGNLPLKKTGLVDYPLLMKETKKYMEIIGLNRDPVLEMKYLSVGERQMVEIAKAISRKIRILIMDEPTAALNEEETHKLFEIVKGLSAEGISVIYISHRLDEIFEVSGRVMVMRDGTKVQTLETSKTDKNEIVRLMVGREIKDMYPHEQNEKGDFALEVDGLSIFPGQDVSFSLRKGEILGLFGIMGAGRARIVEAIFGNEAFKCRSLRIDGAPAHIRNPHMAIKYGLAYVPSERKKEGLILIHSVKENISIAALSFFKKLVFFLDHSHEAETANKWVSRMSIKTPSLATQVESLSGGNQQKVVLAKWMMTEPKVLFMNEPTRGIDVGAKIEVYKLMGEFCKNGLGIVLISSELPEIMSIADRILTIQDGNITGEFNKGEYDQEMLLSAALGEQSDGNN